MFFDALTMACMADELRATILGGRVQKVLLPDSLSVGLEIYARHHRHYLLASAHSQMGRLLLSSTKLRRGVDKETGLLLLLRKYADGAIISSIEQPPWERVLRLGFDHAGWGHNELIIELMGRHSNIILVGAGNEILDAVKRVGPHVSRVRPILPGQAYAPPPPQAKLPPAELTEYRLRQMLASPDGKLSVWQALVKGLRGVSPLLAREIAHRAVGDPRATAAQVTRLTPLLEAVRELLSPLDSRQWQPSLALEDGRPVVYAPYVITHRGEPEAVASMSQAIERYTDAVASADPYEAARRPVREAIATARRRLERRRDALERTVKEGAGADELRQWGEWILAYAHTIEPGQTELVADTGAGEALHIPLDPTQSAVDNAQGCFARYRKAQRASQDGPARLAEAEFALSDLEQLETDLQLAGNRPEIEAVRAALVAAGYQRAKGKGRGRPQRAPKIGPLTVTSSDGLTILVGRNSRQNDDVTFRRAQGDDWWFHARGVPGAHVIVHGIAEELPEDTIRRAAELAAYFSRLQGEPSVTVDYTRRRHVRRIRGAAPGLVTYSHEKTIRVTPRGPD
jgi:predicted ribosome quality control (RQC) complex YloA/Tae2 family protein